MKKTVAGELLKIEAVFLRPDEPFTWASGIKSPIYCDNRLILTAPKTRDIVESALAQKIKEEFPEDEILMTKLLNDMDRLYKDYFDTYGVKSIVAE